MDLPGDLGLPLERGAPWWYWLGGRPALDFVNTLRERWWRRVETLVTDDDLAEWLRRAGVLAGPAVPRPGQLAAARRLREAIDTGLVAALAGAPTPLEALDEINRWLPDAAPRPALAGGTDGPVRLVELPPEDAVRQALATVALDAARMLGSDERRRLRICASDTCSARFYDASPAGTRRWCSMQGCGNTAKGRRHRARRREPA